LVAVVMIQVVAVAAVAAAAAAVVVMTRHHQVPMGVVVHQLMITPKNVKRRRKTGKIVVK
jgi:hypothetical protein